MTELEQNNRKYAWFRRTDTRGRWTLAALGPLIGVYLCQLTTLQSPGDALSWMTSHLVPGVLTYLVLLLAMLLVERLTDSLLCGMLLTVLPCFCLSIVSHLKQAVTGVPLLVSDLAMFGQMGEAAGYISPEVGIGQGTWLAIILAVALFLTAFCFSHPVKRAHWQRRLATCTVLLAALPCVLTTPMTAAVLDGTDEGESQFMRNDRLGFLAGFYSAARQSTMRTPDIYNEDNMNRILLQLHATAPAAAAPEVKPNVVVLVSESFFDPTRLPNVTFSGEPVPNYRALAEDFPSGIFLSNTYAGGTGNVEMEIFTGIPSAFLGSGESLTGLSDGSAYDRVPSIVKAFTAQGYRADYVHAYTNALYERTRNIPALGFDQALFSADFTVDLTNTGDYPSDDSLVDQLIAQFEAKGDDPIFLWGMSMENHQPYYAGKFSEPSPVTGTSDLLDDAELGALDALLYGLYDADASLGRLVDYFSNCGEPTILVFLGDHLPGLYQSGDKSMYQSLNCVSTSDTSQWTPEELQKMHGTNYLVWNNYGAQLEAPETVSCTGLGSRILSWAGIPKPLYFTWVDRAMEQMLLYRERLFITADGMPYNEPPEDCTAMVGTYRSIVYDILYGEQYVAEAMTAAP